MLKLWDNLKTLRLHPTASLATDLPLRLSFGFDQMTLAELAVKVPTTVAAKQRPFATASVAA